MSQRAKQLHDTVDGQIDQLIEVLSNAGEEALHLPCPGREKLGDGTTGAIATHTATNYQRIATFVATSEDMVSRHGDKQQSRHRVPRFVRALSHTPPDHSQHGRGDHDHDDSYTADSASSQEITRCLEAAREQLAAIAGLTDEQLDAVPPKDSFRFCDGQRTLEQVLAGLLKHQGHQVQTITTALTQAP